MNKLGVISFVIRGYTLFYTSTVSEVNVDNSGICLQYVYSKSGVCLQWVYNDVYNENIKDMAVFKAVVRFKRPDGFYPVYIRVTHQRKAQYIKTDKMVDQKGVDKSNGISYYFKFLVKNSASLSHGIMFLGWPWPAFSS